MAICKGSVDKLLVLVHFHFVHGLSFINLRLEPVSLGSFVKLELLRRCSLQNEVKSFTLSRLYNEPPLKTSQLVMRFNRFINCLNYISNYNFYNILVINHIIHLLSARMQG